MTMNRDLIDSLWTTVLSARLFSFGYPAFFKNCYTMCSTLRWSHIRLIRRNDEVEARYVLDMK